LDQRLTPLLTARLELLELRPEAFVDQHFILELLNQESFIHNIGDRAVHDLVQAGEYMLTGPSASYRQHGFGLLRIDLRETREPIGICGLLQRDYLPEADLGYALLDRHCGKGYASEAARAVLARHWERHDPTCVFAITALDNPASTRLLESLGFTFLRCADFPGQASSSRLYRLQRPRTASAD
jgi:RimJ/RimL family protein N-acetyltransferase